MENLDGRQDVRHRRARENQSTSYSSLPYHVEEAVYKPEVGDLSGSMTKHKDTIDSYWALLVALALIICLALIHLEYYHHLPTALTTSDEVPGSDLFITERAKSDLRGLVDIGEKVVGSYANQVLAVEYLKHHLQQIQAQARNNKTVQIDVQTCSGQYHVDGNRRLTNVYRNMVNVVARLSHGETTSNAVLVNCHFDSHPSSPGASDDGLNCAVMLEVLRVLSRSETILTHDVIFLFNGAEENPLQGSHGFITQHAWASDAKVILNFDSAGHGGRESLFQTGSGTPWVTEYYGAAVPHPSGSVIITDLFESGLIPSDTDFRIFRDFGGLTGLDMAHNIGGYTYHTYLDELDIIPDGTYQHTGDNMMALVKVMANAEEVANGTGQAGYSSIFYDFLGLFFVNYTMPVAIVINILVILLAFAAPVVFVVSNPYPKQSMLTLTIVFAAQVLGIVLGLALALLFGMINDWTGHAMSWFTKNWLIVGLTVTPALIPSLLINMILTAKPIEQTRLGIGQQILISCEAVVVFWALVLFFLTCFGVRSAYLLALTVGFPAAANIIAVFFGLQRRLRLWVLMYLLVGLLIPLLYGMWLGSMTTAFIPIIGRMGSDVIPDLYISMIFGGLAVLFGSFWAPLVSALERPVTVIVGAVVVSVILLLGVLLTPLGFPYAVDPEDPTPQRFWLIHAERTLHGLGGNVIYNDSGYWLQNLDRNSPELIRNAVPEMSEAQLVEESCLDAIFCGMPLWKTRDLSKLNKSTWIPAEAPTIIQYEPSSLIGTWDTTRGEKRTLYLNIPKGPTHLSLFIGPRPGVTLDSWSLLENIPEPIHWNGRLLYFVFYSYGSEPDYPWRISLDLTVPQNVSPAIDIALNAHYLHNTTQTRAPYQSILDELPVWVAPLYWTSTYKSFIF